MTDKSQPAATLRDGAIKATIWKNAAKDADKNDFYSVNIVRGYQDQDGNWKDTTSFSGAELLRVSNLAQRSYNKILQLRAQDGAEA